ncbi:MAG TPA: hypothetical protein VLS89_07100, partial [Candidatus Nanopelagicales bacterium]|nr:hypothetical protein [Candidatus Nanopelagicales bacterium]
GFVTALEAGGAPRWGRAIQSPSGAIRAIDATVSRVNYLLVTGGYASGDVDFGLSTGAPPHAGDFDAYLAAYQLSDGMPLWVQPYGDAAQQMGIRLAVDPAGNVLWTGYAVGAISFDGQQPIPVNYIDAFAVKLAPPAVDGPGEVIWSQLLGDDSEQVGLDISASPLGNVVVAGYATASFRIGPTLLEYEGGRDVWVASLRP